MKEKPDLDRAYALETPDDNKRLYREWAESYDADFVRATTYRFPAVVAQTYLDGGGTWPCLDVGCGTGAVAEHFPDEAIIDGIDLSPEMLDVAREKRCYRALIEANLKEALDLPDGAYEGLVSSGTFTHGHVGPEAMDELIRILKPRSLAVITVRPDVWEEKNFGRVFGAMVERGLISEPTVREERVYADPASAPEHHEEDVGLIVQFLKL